MSYSKLDQAISNIEYANRKRQRDVDNLSKKIQPTEKDKIDIGEKTEYLVNVKTLIDAVKEEINKNLGKLPPQATDLEESVIAGIILDGQPRKDNDGNVVAPPAIDQVKSFLKSEHFYVEAHAILYEAVLALIKAGVGVDMRTVAAQLRRSGKLEIVGGAYFIAEITSKLSSSANIVYHARIMVEYAIKRKLILAASEAIQDAYDDTTDCFEIVDKVRNQLAEIQKWRRQK